MMLRFARLACSCSLALTMLFLPAVLLRAQEPTSGGPSAGAPPDSTPRAPRTLRPEDLKGLAWRSIGPANMGGRVADIALAPGNAKTFFVGFGTSGLFKTNNAGTTFAPVFDKEETASIGSVVVADAPPDWSGWKEEEEKAAREAAKSGEPEESAKDAKKTKDAKGGKGAKSEREQRIEKGKAKIVWVGTGEGNGRNSSSWGRGVYRSVDGGGTFTNVGLRDAHDIPRLAVDPRDPDVCYAAALGHLWGPNAERGVYKTADGGKTWKPVLQIDENTGAIDVILDPSDPSTVYAAMYMRRRTAFSFRSGGPEGGIYRSKNGGGSWTKLSGGLPAQTGRIGLDVYAKDPRILYAVVESDSGGGGTGLFDDRSRSGGVFRSEDHGDTWTRVSERTPRSFYFSKVRVDPTNDQRVYLLGFVLYVSDDGGKTFRAGGARRPHVDLHAFVIDPADHDHLLMGTDGGIYVSWDGAKTWDFLNHLATGQFYNIALDQSDPYRIGGGLQDNGSWVGPSGTIMQISGDTPGQPLGGATNAEWQFVNEGDGYHFAFDPNDPNIVYAEWQGGGLVRTNLVTGQRKMIFPSPKEGQQRIRFNWNSPFFVSPHVKPDGPVTLYMGGSSVFKLLDRGAHWLQISEDLSTRDIEKIMTVGSEAETHGTVVSLAESPVEAGMLWAGTDDGLVHMTKNDGKSWKDVTPPETGGRYVSRIEPSHHDRETAYVAIDGHRSDDMEPHLYKTTDGGESWISVAGDLPRGAPVIVVREDRANPRVLYVGTEVAAYVSIDGGSRWIKLNGESLPTVAVDDLQQHSRERDLVAGTHGRSIYVLDEASPLSQLDQEVLDSEVHLFDMRPAKPRLFRPYEGVWTDRVFTARNPPMGAIITYWLRDAEGDDVSIAIADAEGRAVRKLSGSAKAGINRAVWDLQIEEIDRLPNPDGDLGQKEFVPPGDYRVTVTRGKVSASKRVTVLPPPGVTPPKPERGRDSR
jgi:photosystem II stability/assembly factor-like uncharacterized protein